MDKISAKNRIIKMSDYGDRDVYDNLPKMDYKQIYYALLSSIPFSKKPLHTASCKFLYYGALRYDKFSVPTPNDCDEDDFTMFKNMVKSLSVIEGKSSINVPTLKLDILKWKIYNAFNFKYIDETSKELIVEYQKELSNIKLESSTINLESRYPKEMAEFNEHKENISKILSGLESNSFCTTMETKLPYLFVKKETNLNFEMDKITFKIEIIPEYIVNKESLIGTNPNNVVEESGASRWQNGMSIIKITTYSLIDDSKRMPPLVLYPDSDSTPIENWNFLFTLTYNIIEKIWWNLKALNIETSNWAPVPKDIPSILFKQLINEEQIGFKLIANPSNIYKIYPRASDNNSYNLGELKDITWAKKCKMYANIYAETGQYKESLFWLNVAVESLIADFVNSVVKDKTVLSKLLEGVKTYESAEEILVKQFPTMKGKVQWPDTQKHPSVYSLIDKALLNSETKLNAKEIKKRYSKINNTRNDLFHGKNVIVEVEKLRKAFEAYDLLYNELLPYISAT